MERFFLDLYSSIMYSIKKHKTVYLICGIFILAGLLIGIILASGAEDFSTFITVSNKRYSSYLKGTALLSDIFIENIKWIIIGSVICLVLGLSTISFAFGCMYLSYQSALLVLYISAFIKKFGFTGALNGLLFIFPFNFIIIILMGLSLCTFTNFIRVNLKLRRNLFNINDDKLIFVKLGIFFVLELLLCIILSYVIPLLLKSFIIVSY